MRGFNRDPLMIANRYPHRLHKLANEQKAQSKKTKKRTKKNGVGQERGQALHLTLGDKSKQLSFCFTARLTVA